MSEVHKSLKEVVQETFQRNKGHLIQLAQVKNSLAANSLNDEMNELGRVVADRIHKFKEAVRGGEEVVEGETRRNEEMIENLKANINRLGTKLSSAQEIIRRKDLASPKIEENLLAKINDLQNDVKQKEESIESRNNEIKALKSRLDSEGKQASNLDLAIEQAKEDAQRAQRFAESCAKKVMALETRLRNTEEVLRQKEGIIKGLQQNLTAKMQYIDAQQTDNEVLLADRDRQIADLSSQLKVLTNGIKDMSFFFRQADALGWIEKQHIPAPFTGRRLKIPAEKPAMPHLGDAGVAPAAPDPARENVPPVFFERLKYELTGIMGPMASMIVRDHVLALGESMETFPKTRLRKLLEIVSAEIPDKGLRNGFQERFIQAPSAQ